MTQYPSAPGGQYPGTGQRLVCPKCEGEMRTYERSGVHIDQCTRCRGVFLDFGELEALTRIEAQASQPPPPAPAPPPAAYPQAAYPPPAAAYPPAYHHGHPYRHRGGWSSLFFSS